MLLKWTTAVISTKLPQVRQSTRASLGSFVALFLKIWAETDVF